MEEECMTTMYPSSLSQSHSRAESFQDESEESYEEMSQERRTSIMCPDFDFEADGEGYLFDVNSERSRVDSLMYQKKALMTYDVLDIKHRRTRVPASVDMSSHCTFISKLRKLTKKMSHPSEASYRRPTLPPYQKAYQLSYLEVISAVSVLEETLDQLQLLSCTSNNRPWRPPDMAYKTLEERFEDPTQKDFFTELHAEMSPSPNFDTMKMKKVQSDRAYMEEILTRTSDELKVFGVYPFLARMVIQEMLTRNEETHLINEEKLHKKEMAELRKHVKNLKKTLEGEVTKMEEQINVLRDRTEQELFYIRVEDGYVDRWEDARNEQHKYNLHLTEQKMRNHLSNTRIAIDVENRAYYEIKAYMIYDDREVEQEIEDWEKKMKADLERMERQVNNLKTKRELQHDKMKQIAQDIHKREHEIQAYLLHRARRDSEATQANFLYAMACRIQLWWRRIMRRRAPKPQDRRKSNKHKKTKKK